MNERLPGWVCSLAPPHQEPPLLVRWGHPLGAEKGKVFNRVEAVRRSLDEQAVRDFWSLYHLPHQPVDHRPIPAGGDPERMSVRVFLFDLRLLDVEILQAPPRMVGATLTRIYPRLQRLAQRALYVLGLHAGSVDIAVEGISRRSSTAQLTLLGVNAGPPLSGPVADSLAQTLQRVYQAMQLRAPRPPVMLEVEPEFVVGSAKLFEKPPRQPAAESDLSTRKPRRERVHRVRAAASSPLRLVMALRRQLAKTWRKKKPEHGVIRVGSCPLAATPTEGAIRFQGVQAASDTLRALDTFLSVPLLLLEDPRQVQQRHQLGYGLWGDFSQETRDGFTYRVLSSHWLWHPRLALSVLCLARLVIQHAADLAGQVPPEMTSWPMHQAFVRAEKGPFLRWFPVLWRAIQQTPTYRRYEPELRYLQREIEAQRSRYEGLSLHQTWQLSAS